MKKYRLGPLFTPPSLQGTLGRPGIIGGANWGGGAFDPRLGLFIVNTNDRGAVEQLVKNPDGTVTPWMIEGGSPNALFRLGFTKNSLPAGTELIIEGYQAKDGANRGVGAKLTYMDGKSLFLKPPGEDK